MSKLTTITILVLIIGGTYSQASCQEKLDIDGAILIGKASGLSNQAGTIQWTGSDLLLWNGSKWVSLTNGIAFDGQVTDFDGNSYRTIQIGSQEWMAENLRTTKYNDGSVILQTNNYQNWQSSNVGAWCWYDTSAIYEPSYGKLYNWYAVNDSKGLCPTGWHVPTDADWTTLTNFLGGESGAGGKLKEKGLAHWLSPNIDATNESGFTGLPGGFRESNGTFFEFGTYGSWWTGTEYQTNFAWYRNLYTINGDVGRFTTGKNPGRAVRCLKN